MMTIDYTDLIGKPWVWGARGPDAYDCFGLLKEVMRRLGIDWQWEVEQDGFTVDLARKIITHTLDNTPWRKVDDGTLQVGDAILMGSNANFSHVCPVVTEHGDALHTSAGSVGVVLLDQRRIRRYGFMRQEVYRWHGS